ncbi:piggyBac transposable element-derived protein 4 [Trichonephila clavipes]|nr:piggyBac transposable element-derived protein 4 [Trichonephila clavipes]
MDSLGHSSLPPTALGRQDDEEATSRYPKKLSMLVALDMLFSLPSDQDDSEIEADKDTFSELQVLENLDKSSASSGSNFLMTEELPSADGEGLHYQRENFIEAVYADEANKKRNKVWCLAQTLWLDTLRSLKIILGRKLLVGGRKAKTLNLGKTVVTKLTEDVKHTGRLIAHNYFSSLRLANSLFSVGTVKLQRKDLLQMLKAKNKQERCESMFLTKEDVAAIKWMNDKW